MPWIPASCFRSHHHLSPVLLCQIPIHRLSSIPSEEWDATLPFLQMPPAPEFKSLGVASSLGLGKKESKHGKGWERATAFPARLTTCDSENEPLLAFKVIWHLERCARWHHFRVSSSSEGPGVAFRPNIGSSPHTVRDLASRSTPKWTLLIVLDRESLPASSPYIGNSY